MRGQSEASVIIGTIRLVRYEQNTNEIHPYEMIGGKRLADRKPVARKAATPKS
ncbi:MAG: hypothetical protein WA821_01025 [Anaerolineales bacterium]